MNYIIREIKCLNRFSRRRTGERLGSRIPTLIPPLAVHAQAEDDELREACLQCLEAAMHACRKDVEPFYSQVREVALENLKYDPNYEYDSDEDMVRVEQGRVCLCVWLFFILLVHRYGIGKHPLGGRI